MPVPAPASPGPAHDPVAITPAERRVLSALCHGGSNRSIAAALVLSTRTVEGHISNLLLKTGCRSRTQLVLWALRHGTAPVGSAPMPA
ncbi:MAG: response regulator transcription factor [Cyanobium sp.]